ncbi:MAG: HEAT repeat domain-containing protein [Planctomycetia bacterium]|nr:HEAT repeat domain-containing protein [Planctomycetia bacterium]
MSTGNLWADDVQPPPIQVPERFVVEVAAAPPVVQHPIMAGFDDRGRLYVAENAGLNLKSGDLLAQTPNSIRRLEDTDGDGVFDKFTLFADKMTFPQGALWHDGSLFVASPPSIWKLTDTDDDGVADRREELVTKFGFTGNAADVHGCFLDPTGRICWCDGRHGHDFAEKDGRPATKGLAARVFLCDPDGRNVEVFCGGGMDNPVEVAFTAEGEMLGTMTFYNPDDERQDALVHFVYGGVYPKKHHCTSEFKRTGDLMPALSRFGVSAPSGLARYRGTHFGQEYQNNFFSVHFNTHKILRHVLVRDGATFRSMDSDFLVSSSSDFHPTDVLEDPDGSLLVIDTGGWFRIGCPTSQVAKPEILGAIYRVRRKGGRVVDDPWGRKLKPPADETILNLLQRLGDERPALQDQAVAEIARRGEAEHGRLLLTLLSSRPMNRAMAPRPVDVRQRVVWAMSRAGDRFARGYVRAALDDPAMEVRLAAVRSAGVHRDAEARSRLEEMLARDEPPVRREAATALGRIGGAEAVPALLDALHAGGDRFIEHAVIYALIEINDPEATRIGLVDPVPHVRRAVLIALDQMNDGKLTREEVAAQLDTDDPALQATALEIISMHEGWSGEILSLLRTWLAEDKPPPQDRAALLRGALLAFCKDVKVQSLVAEALHRPATRRDVRLLLLEVISRSELEPLPEAWFAQLGRALKGDDPAMVSAAIAAINGASEGRFDARLLEIAAGESYPNELRASAAASAARRGATLGAGVFALLTRSLSEESPPLLRLAAAEAIGSASLDADQLAAAVPLVAKAGPLELPILLRAFEKPAAVPLAGKLVQALAGASGLPNLSPAQLDHLLQPFPEDARRAAAPLRARLSVDLEVQKRVLAELEPKIASGDAQRGREVFLSKKTSCTACHRVHGSGGSVGPDLSKIGQARSERDLVEAVVFPSSSLARGYESYGLVAADGRSHVGVIARETADAIYLRTAQQAEIRVPRSEVEQLEPSRVSVMPQGLEKTMTTDDLKDLIAYLRSLK